MRAVSYTHLVVEKSIIGEGSEIYGEVHSSVIGAGVTIGKGSVVRNSIIMKGTQIGEGVTIDKSIVAENCQIGNNVVLGVGEEAPNKLNASIYSFGLVTIGEDSVDVYKRQLVYFQTKLFAALKRDQTECSIR